MKRIWQTSWRITLCALLLVWIFHCIFVNEARLAASPKDWALLQRPEQWKLGWSEGPGRLWEMLKQIQTGWLILSLVLVGATIILSTVRWRMALAVQGIELPLRRATEISLVAQFFNAFLLGSTGGDLMKAYYAARETHHKKTEAVVTVFVDRLVGLWAMLIFAGLMMLPNLRMLFSSSVSTLACLLILGMLVACSTIALLAFRGGVSRRWAGARHWLRRLPKGESLERSLDSCRLFGKQRFFLPRTLLLSMLLNLLCVFQWQAVGYGLGLQVPTLHFLALVPIVICIAALPLTPSGLGVRETLFVNMLAQPDPKLATSALTLSLVAYAGSLCWSLVGGVVYLLLREKHHLDRRELEEAPD